MMKKLWLLILFSSCSHQTILKNIDTKLHTIVEKQMASLPDDLWPGFKDYSPLVLYNTVNEQYLLGAPRYPLMGYSYQQSKHRHPLGEKFEQKVYHTAFPKEIFGNEHPGLTRSVFMIDSLERMKALGRDWNTYEWGTIYVHEVFHLFQGEQWNPELVKSSKVKDSKTVKAAKRNKENIALLIKEQKIIKEALLETNFSAKGEILSVCRMLLEARNERYNTIFGSNKTSVLSEQFYETLEGTARYIERHIDFYLKDDLSVRKYINTDLAGYLDKYGVKTYYHMLDQIEVGENYYYETGFALSLLLDKLSPGWKVKAFKTYLWDQLKFACEGYKLK